MNTPNPSLAVRPDQASLQENLRGGGLSPLDVLAILWRGKILIGFMVVLFVAATAYYVLELAKPRYSAHTVIALESREGQVLELESVISALGADSAAVYTEIEVLRSRNLVGKVVAQLDLTSDPEFNPALQPQEPIARLLGLPRRELSQEQQRDLTIDGVLAAINVTNVRQSLVFRITVVTLDARKSALIANTLSEAYIQDQVDLKFAATERATEWLTERVSRLKVELEDADAAVQQFETETDLAGPEGLEGLNRQLKDLRDRLAGVTVSAQTASQRVDALVAVQNSGDMAEMVAVADDTVLRQIWQGVQAGTRDAELAEQRFAAVLDTARNVADRSTMQTTTLTQAVADLQAQIEMQSADLVMLQQLRREAEASRLIYEYFLNRLKETSVQQGIQEADARVLSTAFVPGGPVSPRLSTLLPLGLVFGLLLGIALVLVREYRQNTFRTADELEAASGHAVLGQIPLLPSRDRKNLMRFIKETPNSPAGEAVRNLRTSVMMSNVDNPPQVIMVTSSQPGEGKTTHSIMLANNYAALGKKVLLIEGDIRRRVFSNYFDIKGKAGLVSVFMGEVSLDDAVVHQGGFSVLQGEATGANASDLYSSNKFHDFIADLRTRFDVIIIDTPPVLAVPDARVLCRQVDGVIYAVRWDQTGREQVRQGIRALESAGGKVLGTMLTQVDPKGLKQYGYASYGVGYDNY
ncbi:polysaccharide biosynthesis tyrosine autokinase [Octadecabacter sp. R77987]|uniref:polysaccharide biosynthesis tyrosine autokinase n=1 Tax=Octadecabacter sp. R77987 TaxID=3093874 RepID=UPI00366BE8AB